MSTGSDQDAVAALLLQVTDCAERIADLGTRQAADSARLEQLAEKVGAARARIDAIAGILGRHAAIVTGLDGLDRQVAAIASQVADLAGPQTETGTGGYEPVPPPRWWRPGENERQAGIDRLRAWVEQVYQPGYGRMAAALPACWDNHPLCLYTLDWRSSRGTRPGRGSWAIRRQLPGGTGT